MNKRIMAILLALSITAVLAANENEINYGNNFDWTIRAGFSIQILPMPSDGSGIGDFAEVDNDLFGYVITALLFGSVSFGGGVQYTFIPQVLTPGVYADVHFNLLSWAAVYLFSKYHVIFLQAGVRIFNRFEINYIGLEPFLGANVVYLAVEDEVPMTLLKTGLNVSYNLFNFEYAFIFSPVRNPKDENPFLAFHRLTFSWKMNGY